MNYIAVIHKEIRSEYGVSFPDFPGCVTAGATIDEAKGLAQEALQFHVDGMIEDGDRIPSPSTLEDVLAPDAIAYLIVSIDIKRQPIRVNLSFDPNLLAAIDAKAQERGMTRSGFLADVARKELHQ